MALSYDQWRDIVLYLQEHPEAIEDLRVLVLSKEMIAVPARLMEVIEGIAELRDSIADLRQAQAESTADLRQSQTESSAAFRADLRELRESLTDMRSSIETLSAGQFELVRRLDRHDGRMGNIEGGILEDRYERNLRDWLGAVVRRASRIFVSDLDRLTTALETGTISAQEHDQVSNLDMVAIGQDLSGIGEKVVACELSTTINLDDVWRAHERAATLRKAGYATAAFCGGYRASDDATALAHELGIHIDLRRPPA